MLIHIFDNNKYVQLYLNQYLIETIIKEDKYNEIVEILFHNNLIDEVILKNNVEDYLNELNISFTELKIISFTTCKYFKNVKQCKSFRGLKNFLKRNIYNMFKNIKILNK